jgi:Fic family protein
LQEAKDSSAIEYIITSQDILFCSDSLAKQFTSLAAKEVYNYPSSLKFGFELVRKTGLLTSNNIIEIHSVLEETRTGFRKVPGTALKKDQTGEVIYTLPQSFREINDHMKNLEIFINASALSDLDP